MQASFLFRYVEIPFHVVVEGKSPFLSSFQTVGTQPIRARFGGTTVVLTLLYFSLHKPYLSLKHAIVTMWKIKNLCMEIHQFFSDFLIQLPNKKLW